MEHSEVLPSVVVLLFAAIFIVIIFKRLRLSPVLGYFVAGGLIGDHGFKIVKYEQIHALAEYGVVFLLYAIGLELSFERLKAMRKYVFGLGTLQVFITAVIIAGVVVLLGGNGSAAVIIGGGLALSSTAVVLQVLEESRSQSTQVGRISFAILLLQDFIVVPLLVIIPLLAGDNLSSLPMAIGLSFIKAAVALILIFLCGRLFLRPVFRLISSDNEASHNELFIAATLLIALAAAFGTEYMGLSLALGAFVAGILVAETEFQLKAEESIYPFKGLLLGLFFMSVGMTIDIQEIFIRLDKILIFSFGLLAIKSFIIAGLCILFGFKRGISIHSGLLLAQGGEFAFILFNLGMNNNIIDEDTGKNLLLIVTFSMALTPLLSFIGSKVADILDVEPEKSPTYIIEKGTQDLTNHVIVAGFGRVGRMVSRMLEYDAINHIIIDVNNEKVNEELAEGFPIFKGDISQLETLIAAGAERAQSVIIAINNQVTVKKSLKAISKHFPELVIIVRAADLRYSSELYELGATIIVPEAYETGLQLGGAVLKAVGISSNEIGRIKEQFRAGNYIMAKKDEDWSDEREET